jgi:FHA domain-containing protein
MSLLRRIEKTLDQRLRSIFAAPQDEPGAREAIELYREALEQLAARAQVGRRGERLFPYNRITIELLAKDAERRAILEAIFEPAQMIEDVQATLIEERVTAPPDLSVSIEYFDEAAVEVRVRCEKAELKREPAPSAKTKAVRIPQARLITLSGAASVNDFVIERQRINLGREPEVTDSLGRAIRRNELHFPDNGHEANASVSRSHAHIRYDPAAREWRIFDDGSSLGTSLFRDGRRIEVPSHAARGVALRPGDEIYLGQVRLRFEMP